MIAFPVKILKLMIKITITSILVSCNNNNSSRNNCDKSSISTKRSLEQNNAGSSRNPKNNNFILGNRIRKTTEWVLDNVETLP